MEQLEIVSDGLKLEESLSLIEKLQKAEARALASGQALNELIDYLLSIPFQPCAETTMEVSDVYVENLRSMAIYARETKPLTHAREVMRKAEEWDAVRALTLWEVPKDEPLIEQIIEDYSLLRSLLKDRLDEAHKEYINGETVALEDFDRDEITTLRTERDELAALVERKDDALMSASGRFNCIAMDLASGLKPIAEHIEQAEHAALQAYKLQGPTVLADLKAQVRREALEAYHDGMDTVATCIRKRMESPDDTQVAVVERIGAAELRRMAGEGK